MYIGLRGSCMRVSSARKPWSQCSVVHLYGYLMVSIAIDNDFRPLHVGTFIVLFMWINRFSLTSHTTRPTFRGPTTWFSAIWRIEYPYNGTTKHCTHGVGKLDTRISGALSPIHRDADPWGWDNYRNLQFVLNRVILYFIDLWPGANYQIQNNIQLGINTPHQRPGVSVH